MGRRYSTDPVSGKVVGYGSPTYTDSNCYSETVPGSGGYAFGALTCSGQTQRVIEAHLGSGSNRTTVPKAEFSSARSTPT